MRYVMFLTALLVISCPRPAVLQIPETEYLKEAAAIYRENPIRARGLLENNVLSDRHSAEKNSLLLKVYLDQREYARAADLLDSVGWVLPIEPAKRDLILLKTQGWYELAKLTDSELMRGIAYSNLDSLDKAITALSAGGPPDDYRLIKLAEAYIKRENHDEALTALFSIGAIRDYLFDEYQEVLFDILLALPDLARVRAGITQLKDPALREYVKLRIYEKEKARAQLMSTSWNLINNHPRSPGAYHALGFVHPKTKREYKTYGRVLYYNNEYMKASKYLKRGILDDTAQYYLGRIYYALNEYTKALQYFANCSWSSASYYRGRIYERRGENGRAIEIYDSLYQLHRGSEYAVRGQKRKAFLLEEIGDTMSAVETFLGINERNTKFRAAMQLLKVGDLRRGLHVLQGYDEPEFIYWRIRALDRLGEPAESLKRHLSAAFPLSYYTLAHYDHTAFLDTLSLNAWIGQFGDTLVTFTRQDSLHIMNATRFFQLNEGEYAGAELKMIKADQAQDLVFLSRLCAQNGADKLSIQYALRVKRPAAERNILRLPRELLRLQYPIRYAFTITDNYPDLNLALAMIWQESLFDPGAVSPANAKGLMQIIPSTAKTIAQDLGTAEYAYSDPTMSIKFGMHYFKQMFREFGSVPLSLAAYNAGPVRVRRWVKSSPNFETEAFIELIPYDETRNYVKSILGRKEIYRFVTGIE
ncbi:MAG: transglycosylase SLT domain-containing protein [candidate division WOR-3 bacterium]|nr:MAG: transglycosylase SLT domain-containing protein [candidate division WOR-3 bacterium]